MGELLIKVSIVKRVVRTNELYEARTVLTEFVSQLRDFVSDASCNKKRQTSVSNTIKILETCIDSLTSKIRNRSYWNGP